MVCTSDNYECSCKHFGDSLQLTKWILDSGATCHTTLHVSNFILGSLEYTDKNIEVGDVQHVLAKQKVQAEEKMCNNNQDTFITTLQNLLLAPDLCDMMFSIITLINS